jgi:hypothetical protein
MGKEIGQEDFGERDYQHFAERLEECLAALGQLLERPGFGVGPATVGAELELFLVDGAGRPLPDNQAVRAAVADPRVTLELDRFNLELNSTPVLLAGQPFAALGGELHVLLDHVASAARYYAGRPALIGILPTLRPADFGPGVITDVPRYRALDSGLRRLRGDPFRIRIAGADPLAMASDDIAPEGANSSFQIHLRVDPADFTRTYNAVQLATAPTLAVSGNSPTFLGHRLWEETRIVLFKQSVDDRGNCEPRRHPARTALGTGWLRGGPLELFTEAIRLHRPLLPVLGGLCRPADDSSWQAPPLAELRLHQGTVWRWNRVIYDPAAGGHLRIEMRALPSGPTVVDMLANAAFLIGLSLWLADQDQRWTYALPFERADHSFYRAAQQGPAELARRAPRPDADGCRQQACGRTGAGGTARAAPGRRDGGRGRQAARCDLRPGSLRPDRRRLAARHTRRRQTASRPRACAGHHAGPLPPMRRNRAARPHLASPRQTGISRHPRTRPSGQALSRHPTPDTANRPGITDGWLPLWFPLIFSKINMLWPGGRNWVRTSDPSLVRRKQDRNHTRSQNATMHINCENSAC